MKNPQRLIPDWPFPSYIFIPGENPHPKKAGGYMQDKPDPVATPIELNSPGENKFLRYALDLYNYGYFWESHVYFEALWNAHKRQGSVSDFLKGMIKLGAAGVKLEVKQPENAIEHFQRAKELFESVELTEGPAFLGFDLKEIKSKIDKSIKGNKEGLLVFPEWN